MANGGEHQELYGRLSTLEKLTSEYGGKSDAFWKAQWEWNARIETKVDRLGGRIEAVEKRLFWFSGFGAAAGAIIGSLIRLFG